MPTSSLLMACLGKKHLDFRKVPFSAKFKDLQRNYREQSSTLGLAIEKLILELIWERPDSLS